jgi:hypothetical protein
VFLPPSPRPVGALLFGPEYASQRQQRWITRFACGITKLERRRSAPRAGNGRSRRKPSELNAGAVPLSLQVRGDCHKFWGYCVHRSPRPRAAVLVNWRRGLIRPWLSASLAWIMGWALYLVISDLDEGFRTGSAITIPVVLCAPSAAMLVVGLTTKWALQGFAPSGDQ